MPISNECLTLFCQFATKYKEVAASDNDYPKICDMLDVIQSAIITNSRSYKDDRIISLLSSTALMLTNNPMFTTNWAKFLSDFHQQTGAVDSFLTRDLSMRTDLDYWTDKEIPLTFEVKDNLLLKELKAKLELRNERWSIFGKPDFEQKKDDLIQSEQQMYS